jgi:excinuclease UvrABC nuclease subunit
MSVEPAMFDAKVDLGDWDQESLKQIPAKRGIALLATQRGEAILLLPAADMRSRVGNRISNPSQEERSKMPDLAAITRKVWYLRTHSHFETDWAYLELARYLWPKSYRELLSIQLPWFVQMDPNEDVPHFRRGRDVFRRDGIKIGPFPSARVAESFIEIVQDVLDLCRNPRCLAEAPHADCCTYGQMGMCLRPCDATISMEQYRTVMRAAGTFASGDRQDVLHRLEQEMSRCAKELDFERAGQCKKKIDRIQELEGPEYSMARPLDQHRWLTVQSGPSFHQAKVFVAAGGTIAAGPLLDYPLVAQQLQTACRCAGEVSVIPAQLDVVDRYRLALICRLIYTSGQRGGLLLDARQSIDPKELADRIERSVDVLGLRAPRRRKGSLADDGEQTGDSTDK